MKRHWAPWRMAFILGKKDRGCLFCKLPKQKKDRDNLILYRGKHCFLILNKYPYNNGHMMVVPYRHIKDLSKLNRSENGELMELCGVAANALDRTMGPQGHNLGMNLGAAGGAGIKNHLHMHVVPRWVGDTNFMPILADTKILVEHLAQTYDRLAPSIQKILQARRRRKKT
jgi:ATP adenylyltransferase